VIWRDKTGRCVRKFFAGMMFVIILFACLAAGAYHFENFKWGESTIEVKDQLKSANKTILNESPSRIEYEDTMFGDKCKVLLYFTSPLDGKLAMIGITWNDTFVGESIKAVLTKKYGHPHQPNDYTEKYTWLGKEDKNEIRLDYNSDQTKLFYLGGRYYKEFEKKSAGEPGAEQHRL